MSSDQGSTMRAAVGSDTPMRGPGRARRPGWIRRTVRYRGMLVLVLWQVPVQPVIRPNGSLGLMIGGGTDEMAEFSCEGDLISSERVEHRMAAVEADYSLNSRARVDAVAGYMQSDLPSHDGGFGAWQLRLDWQSIGVGGGVAITPSFEEYDGGTTAWPSAYVRAGSADEVHLRADMFPVSALSSHQVARLGVGYNAVERDRPSGFVGVAALGGDDPSTGVAGELTLPLQDRFALRLQGHYSGGHEHPVMAFAVGGRLLFGSGPQSRTSATLPAR